MDSLQFLQLIKQRWYLLAGSVAACLALAAAVSAGSTTQYQSSASLFVAVTAQGAQSPNQGNLLASAQFLDSQLQSFTEFASSPRVIKAASKQSKSQIPSGSVTATNTPGTFLITLTSTAPTALGAKTRANAVAIQLSRYIPSVATRLPSGAPAFAVTIVKPATLPSAASSPRWKVNLALGLMLGLAGGLALLLIMGQLDASRSSTRKSDRPDTDQEKPRGANPTD